jgi:hypothetical protein
MPPHSGPPRLASGIDARFPGCDYSDDEREFLMAIESYKRRNRRPFPTWREVLHVAHSLGYRKVAERREPNSPAGFSSPSPLVGEGAGG